MEFNLLDGRDEGEYRVFGLVEISEILAVQGAFLFGKILFDIFYLC